MRLLVRLLPALCLLANPLLSAKPEENAENAVPLNEKAILLPKVAISEKMKLRPEEKWQSCTVGDFEIVSDASPNKTKEFAAHLHKFHQAFVHLFPKSNNIARGKVTFVLCDSVDKFNALSPKIEESTYQAMGSLTILDKDRTYQVINLDIQSAFMLAEADDSSPALQDLNTNLENIDGDTLMRREYIQLLLRRNQSRPPAWLAEGVSEYFGGMKVELGRISYAKIDKNTLNFFRSRSMLSMSDFFAISYDSPEYKQSVGSIFSKQAFVFVHFGMFAYKMRHQKAFLELVDLACKEPVTEAKFKSIFKMSFAAMEVELRDYLSGGFYRHAVSPKVGKFEPLKDLQLHQLTDAEAGRLKGDILRLIKRYDDARIELISPIMRKHSDARLLGSLGLLDFETGNLKDARKYLEDSTAAKVDHPAPYLALAQLRLQATNTQTPEGKLTPAQLSPILSPLHNALALDQPPVDIYLAIANLWERSQTAPTFDNLAVLDLGVIAYPRNTELIFKNAALKARHGFTDDARSLADLGLKVTRDDATRNRFTQLKSTLPVPATK